MNFALGFYRTRNGSIVRVTAKNAIHMIGHAVASTALKHRRDLYWNLTGDATHYNTELDLTEYLKVKENGTHEGPSVAELFK